MGAVDKTERGRLTMAYRWGWRGGMKAFANLYKQKKRRQVKNVKEEIRKKKKQQKMMMMMTKMKNRCAHDDDVDITSKPLFCTSSLLDDDIVAYEILSRLPVKSLMRFQSVCKRWRYLIQRDPPFHNLHLTRSETRQSLLFLMPLRHRSSSFFGLRECLLSADIFEGRAVVRTISKTESFIFNSILKPVNGLICFIDHVPYGVRICNPSTREITQLIESTFRYDQHGIKAGRGYPTYGFGFDPCTKQHKVICVWRGYQSTPYVACEILTVGNNKWRRIDEVPPYDIHAIREASVYVKGSIYWSNTFGGSNGDPEVIVAFDVGSEKFRVIPVPSFILNQSCDCIDILEVNERVALLRRMDGYTVKLWILDDEHNQFKEENITTTSNRNWTEVTMTLPFRLDANVYRLSFHEVAGTNQLILRSIMIRSGGVPRWLVSLHSYNWKQQTFKKLEVIGFSSISDPSDGTLFTPFVESLLPVSSSSGTGTSTLGLHMESEAAFSTQELRSPVYPFLI